MNLETDAFDKHANPDCWSKDKGVKCKDIKGFLVEKAGYWGDDYRRGFNLAMDLQGQVSIGLNRKCLIEIISRLYMGSPKEIKLLADAIISEEQKLLEVKHDSN